MSERCLVCGDVVPGRRRLDKYDPRQPMFTAEGVVHLGCSRELFDEIHNETGIVSWD